MIRMLLVLLSGASGAVLLASCTSTPATGSVSGRLQVIGGPAPPPPPEPLEGEVRLKASGGTTYLVHTARIGTFSIPVAAGTYTIRGRSPKFGNDGWGCFAGPVTVHRHATVWVHVYCPVV